MTMPSENNCKAYLINQNGVIKLPKQLYRLRYDGLLFDYTKYFGNSNLKTQAEIEKTNIKRSANFWWWGATRENEFAYFLYTKYTMPEIVGFFDGIKSIGSDPITTYSYLSRQEDHIMLSLKLRQSQWAHTRVLQNAFTISKDYCPLFQVTLNTDDKDEQKGFREEWSEFRETGEGCFYYPAQVDRQIIILRKILINDKYYGITSYDKPLIIKIQYTFYNSVNDLWTIYGTDRDALQPGYCKYLVKPRIMPNITEMLFNGSSRQLATFRELDTQETLAI